MAASGHSFINAETCSSTKNVTFSSSRESNCMSGEMISRSVLSCTERNTCSVRSCVDELPPCMRSQDTAPCILNSCCAQVMGVCRNPDPSSSVCRQLESLRLSEIQVVTSSQLAERIQKCPDSFILLDCRPFIAYNMVHVTGALNLNCCDRLTRKRLLCGKIRLEDVISGLPGKEEYKKKKDNCDIIVYDEESNQLDRPGPPLPLKLVVNLLKQEEHNVFYLKGMYLQLYSILLY